MIHTAAVDGNSLDLNFLSCLIVPVGKRIEIIERLITECGFFVYTASISECHSRDAHRRIGYVKKVYRLTVFSEPFYLAFLTNDLKESFCVFRRDLDGTERCVILLPASHIAACRKEPVLVFLSQCKRIHGVSFHARIRGIERNNLIGSIVFASAASEKSGKHRES